MVTDDRRGNSRSPLAGPPEPQPIEVHADDAHRQLSAVAGTDPVFVFGNGSGGQIALELAAAHPCQVRVVVAHEPPLLHCCPMSTTGPASFRACWTPTGPTGPDRPWRSSVRRWACPMTPEPTVHLTPEMTTGTTARATVGLREPSAGGRGHDGAAAGQHRVRPGVRVSGFSGHTPDLAALRAASTTIIPAVGRDSAGEPPQEAALALAEQWGVDAIVLPGGHGGFGSHADGHASAPRELFASH